MSSKTPTAIKPSTATTVKPSTVPKTPSLSKTSATTKTPTKTSASERAASFVTPRASGTRPTSSSSSSSEGSGSPTYYRKRAAELGVECPELTYIADLQDYKAGESMIDCVLQTGDVVGPKMEKSGVMYVTGYTNEGHVVKGKAFAPDSVELEKIVKNNKVVSFVSLHATEPYIKDKHNSPLPSELLYKHDSSATGYMSDAPIPTKTIDNFDEFDKDGIYPSVRVILMQYFRYTTTDKGQRNYGARVFDRHNNRGELTMNFDNDENAMKFQPGRVITLKGFVSTKGVIKIKSRVEDIQDVETTIENVPRLSQTHTPKKLKITP